MKTTKKWSVVGILTLLAACNEIDGRLVTQQNLEILNEKKKVQVLPAGAYNASLGVVSSKKGSLAIKVNNDEKIKMNFPLPRELKDKNFQGPFDMDSLTLGQVFGIHGEILQNVVDGSVYVNAESCVYGSEKRRVCREVCRPSSDGPLPGRPGHDHDGRPGHGGRNGFVNMRLHRDCVEQCRLETVTIYGTQEVQKYDTDYSRTININLLMGAQSVGDFTAREHLSTVSHVIAKGPCFR